MFLISSAIFFWVGGIVPASSILCLVESSVPNVCIAGMTNRFVVFDGKTGRILPSGFHVSGPVTALAVDRNRRMLAVASGRPAEKNTVDIYELSEKGLPSRHLLQLNGPSDQLYSLAFQPVHDGLLSGAGYGRIIYFWDLKSSKEVLSLRQHSDAIRKLDWHPNRPFLASCSCDRTVKIWEIPSGHCFHSFNESTDWLHSVQWLKDGNGIMACGSDRILRVWDFLIGSNALRKSRFAHDAPVIDLCELDDSFLSLGEDGFVKKWSSRDLQTQTKIKISSTPLSCFCLSKEKHHAWIAGFDGNVHYLNLRQFSIEAVHSLESSPRIDSVQPSMLHRGSRSRVRIKGYDLGAAEWNNASLDGGGVKFIGSIDHGNTVEIDVEFPANTVPGFKRLRIPLRSKGHLETAINLILEEQGFDPKGFKSATVRGQISNAGNVDRHIVSFSKGQTLGILLEQEQGSNLDCRFSIRKPNGKLLVHGKQLFPFQVVESGKYEVEVYDREFRIGSVKYWLHVGNFPVSSGVSPTHVQSGQIPKFRLLGVNLGEMTEIELPVPTDIPTGNRLDLPAHWQRIPGARGPFLDSLPQKTDPASIHVPPFGASGFLGSTKSKEKWNFKGSKREKLVVEVMASRLGTTLDSFLEIRDSNDLPLIQTVLQPVDQTSVAFRNHDPKTPGIRLEKWGGFSPNDFLYAGGDLLRIRTLPRNPDDDCQFFASGGKRLAWFGTTPTQHPIGQTLLKVIPRKPGEPFDNSGWAPISLPWANDDGDPEIGTDSKLIFEPPSDGVYKAVVSNASGPLELDSPYHLTVRPSSEDFLVSLRSKQSNIASGGSAEIHLEIKRIDGWEGGVQAETQGLDGQWLGSKGYASGTDNNLLLTVSALGTNKLQPPDNATIKISGNIGNRLSVRELSFPKIIWVDKGDVSVLPKVTELKLSPGGKAKVPLVIERFNGFEGRVPLEIRGLPQGVRVLDVGLNGILVPPGQNSRVLEIEADTWVSPVSVPLVISCRREGKPEYIGPGVKLHVIRNDR